MKSILLIPTIQKKNDFGFMPVIVITSSNLAVFEMNLTEVPLQETALGKNFEIPCLRDMYHDIDKDPIKG